MRIHLCPHEIGDRITFIPSHAAACLPELQLRERRVTGTVVQIHAEHRWYRVAYPLDGRLCHECFKF